MENIMKNIFATIMLLMGMLTVAAQEKVEADVHADIVSQYIWRGLDCGNAAIQPALGVSYQGLSLGAWGNYGVTESSDVKEFDLTLSYSTSGLTIGVTDYYFNTHPEYFCYKSGETSHVFEAFAGYDFGVASLTWYADFAGNDYLANGDRAYSSYVEANAPFRLGGLDWNATIGVVPYKSMLYGADSGFAVTNIGLKATKEVKISESFSLPVFAGITANPKAEKAYFVFGFTLQ